MTLTLILLKNKLTQHLKNNCKVLRCLQDERGIARKRMDYVQEDGLCAIADARSH